MRLIYAWYNMQNNSIEINTYDGYILQFDCNILEKGLKTTPWSQHCLDCLALDKPLEYVWLILSGEMQAWLDAEDSLCV
ncbi:MAG: toxin-antitoxin system protein [Lachnospiraceae bacterium]|nr:toxin-antitoxin system protein [Lachnospiraceae bacterium]